MAYSSKPDVSEVLKWLKDLNDWFSVGMKIGVSYSKLRALEDKYPVETEKARTEMVENWLASDSKASWAKLADGMEYADQRWLAKRIRETYNCPKQPTQPKKTTTQKSREQPQAKKPSSAHTASSLPTAPPPPQPPSPPPSPPPYTMPGKKFKCSCNNFTLKAKQQVGGGGGRENVNSSFLPNLSLSRSLSSSKRLQLERKLKKESDEMIFRFGGFVNRILRSFKSRGISVSVLVDCISNFGALPSDREQVPLLQHRLEQMKSASNIDEVFLVISDYISYFNHALMAHLIEVLGNEKDQEELEAFSDYFEIFAKRCVFETPAYMYGYVWVKTEMLVVLKTEEKWVPGDSCSVKELYLYLQKVCGILGVLPHALHVCRMEGGSLELVCRMPPQVVEEVFPLTAEQKRELGEAGLAQLHCVDYCFRKADPNEIPITDSDEAATSDFMSLDEADNEMITTYLAQGKPFTGSAVANKRAAQPARSRDRGRGARPVVKRRVHQQTRDLLLGQLKTCCHYHEQMSQLRGQSCALVTEADMGYDGDSETSSEGPTLSQAFPTRPVRHSRKRLKWRLAHSHF